MTDHDTLRQRLAALSPERRAVLERTMRRAGRGLPSALAEAAEAADAAGAASSGRTRRRRRPGSRMEFGLFFFSGDGSVAGPDRYRLLLDCARYADRHGYSAIWVPERHFVDFGGLYPNPSVLAAAIAVVTERIQIRAGSVVVPLHHPVRIAEEWAMVDNLSGGRVAISAASGWHPNDFTLAPGAGPDRYQRRKDTMFDAIEMIQRLWAGEAVPLAGPDGEPFAARTLPRPRQPRLPMWVSSQGSVDTFVRAGTIGANVLTGLVAQRQSELREKIDAYRRARRDAGHDAAAGRVTAMLHTFLGPADDTVKETVRAPLVGYLKTFLAQQDNFDSGFAQLDQRERDVMLAATFERYFDSLALLGTPDTCEAVIEDLVDIGVDEVACLVDFGVEPDAVLEALAYLTELKDRYRSKEAA